MAGNLADAEDALGTAMLKAIRAFDAHRVQNERAWLTRIVHNACMDRYRHQKRNREWMNKESRKEVSAGQSVYSDESAVVMRGRSPEDELLGRELLVNLAQSILNLPDTLLEPLLMRCLEDMAYSDIADQLNLTNTTVRKRVELARKCLRRNGIS